eukprot:144474_1
MFTHSGLFSSDMDTCTQSPPKHETEVDFENWINITKQRLKEREDKLMHTRITTLQCIINDACQAFENLNSLNGSTQRVTVLHYDQLIHTSLVHECLDKLHLTLSMWNGVNLYKTKQTPTTFRKYFTIGKAWFDQKKKSILTPDFWIKFCIHLQQFVVHAAANYFNHRFHSLQRLYSRELLFRIVAHIFAGEVQYSSSKVQPLIPHAIVKNEESMKQYLLTLHHSLNIQRYIDNYAPSPKAQCISAKHVHQLINKQFTCLTNQYHNEFHKAFRELWNDASVRSISSTSNSTGNTGVSGVANNNAMNMQSMPRYRPQIESPAQAMVHRNTNNMTQMRVVSNMERANYNYCHQMEQQSAVNSATAYNKQMRCRPPCTQTESSLNDTYKRHCNGYPPQTLHAENKRNSISDPRLHSGGYEPYHGHHSQTQPSVISQRYNPMYSTSMPHYNR